jgi:hypothetical protein
MLLQKGLAYFFWGGWRMISVYFDVPQAMMDIFYTHGSPEVILTDQGRELWIKVKYLTM